MTTDLFIYLRERLVTDAPLKSLFLGAGSSSVSVVQPDQRTTAKYPRIVAEVEEGKPEKFGEITAPDILNGRYRLEIVTRQDEKLCPDPTLLRMQISDRCRAVLLGGDEETRAVAGEEFTGDSGAKYSVTQFDLVKVRSLLVNDPLFSRGEIVFSLQLCKVG